MFPFSNNLMWPYPEKSVTGNYENKVFNYRLSRARQPVECPFGIIASRFRVFRKPFEIKVDSVDNVVKAGCVLHNYLRNNQILECEVDDAQLLPCTHTESQKPAQLCPAWAAFQKLCR